MSQLNIRNSKYVKKAINDIQKGNICKSVSIEFLLVSCAHECKSA